MRVKRLKQKVTKELVAEAALAVKELKETSRLEGTKKTKKPALAARNPEKGEKWGN